MSVMKRSTANRSFGVSIGWEGLSASGRTSRSLIPWCHFQQPERAGNMLCPSFTIYHIHERFGSP